MVVLPIATSASASAAPSQTRQSLHQAPMTNACNAISASAMTPPSNAVAMRSRGRGTNSDAIMAAKYATPKNGSGIPKG